MYQKPIQRDAGNLDLYWRKLEGGGRENCQSLFQDEGGEKPESSCLLFTSHGLKQQFMKSTKLTFLENTERNIFCLFSYLPFHFTESVKDNSMECFIYLLKATSFFARDL